MCSKHPNHVAFFAPCHSSLAQNFEKLNPSENATAIHRVDERGLFLHYYQALVHFVEGPPLWRGHSCEDLSMVKHPSNECGFAGRNFIKEVCFSSHRTSFPSRCELQRLRVVWPAAALALHSARGGDHLSGEMAAEILEQPWHMALLDTFSNVSHVSLQLQDICNW